MKRLAVLLTALSLLIAFAAPVTAIQPQGRGEARANKSDNLKSPAAVKQEALRQKGLDKVLSGEAVPKGDNKVVKIAKGQYVELARQGEDSILTTLAQFGTAGPTTPHTHSGAPVAHGGTAGPLHNEIPAPDRSVDNSTIWSSDFSQAYYKNLLFDQTPGASTMRNYYIEQSSGVYAVNGDVSPWLQLPYNEATYGSNYCGDIVCSDTYRFINDSVDALAATFTSTAALNAYLAPFDVWDRYDIDGDGIFNEPDGYIDHYQAVHAGEGEETGGGAEGTDAIWSHRSYAYFGAGPDGTGVGDFGGARIGSSNFWIGDYTVEPENGGVGVFAHEFGHDLGLPDLYDTSGNTGGAENSTGFWTLYSSGSYGSTGIPADGIGSKPVHMGNLEKFYLGWLNYEVARAGVPSSHRIGPSEANTKQAQGVIVVLPKRAVPLALGAPCDGCGAKYFYSGSGDNLNVTMTKTGITGGALTAKVRYETEPFWDYVFLEASSNGGTTWTPVVTNRSDTATDGDSGFNTSRTGITGGDGAVWLDLTATLPGGTNAVRFRYQTDGAVSEPGFQVDNIAIAGTTIGTAETDEGWALAGFRTTTGSETLFFSNYYILSNRQYIGFDKSLQTGPYNFGFGNTNPNWVEHFPYQKGLLIEYWNTQYLDNNVGDHPGEGLDLPVDAHPQLSHWPDGTLMRTRIVSFDSTFGLDKVPSLTVHLNGVATTIPGKPAVPVFSDANNPWVACDTDCVAGVHPGHNQPGWYSVSIPNTGTTVRVKSVSTTGFMQVDINK